MAKQKNPKMQNCVHFQICKFRKFEKKSATKKSTNVSKIAALDSNWKIFFSLTV